MKNKFELINRALLFARPIKKISVSAWADQFRQLPSTSAEPGRWKTSRTPYLREIMDAFTQPNVHRVVAMTSSQVGKSEALNNVIGRFAHLDPCTIMLIQPTQELAEKYSKTRIAPMIQDSKILTPLFNFRNQTILEKYFTGGQLLMTGSNSPANLASQPVRILLCDEVDRFPVEVGAEGDPVGLAIVRTSTFWNYKVGLFSTPTIKNASRIEQEYLLGTQEEWQYQCPNCAEFHYLNFRSFINLDGNIFFRCPDCGFDFSELQIKSAPQKYVAQNPDAIKKNIRSFRVNAFSSPWLSWSRIFDEFDEAKGKPALEKKIFNTRFAESYEYAETIADENNFLQRREFYPAEVPDSVLLLTAAVDIQAFRLEYEVVGWDKNFHSFGIRRDIIHGDPYEDSAWLALDSVLDYEYSFSNGRKIKIARTFVDSGFATRKVYQYCASRKSRFPIKGSGTVGLPIISHYSYPRGYGITLTTLGVNDGKQEVFARYSLEQMHFPRDDHFFPRRGYDEIYFHQLFSEKRQRKFSGGVSHFTFVPIKSHVRNESLDLAVYNLAALKSLEPIDFDSLEHAFRSNSPVVKKSPRKKIVSSSVDIW